jgi:chromosome segregation ATPase
MTPEELERIMNFIIERQEEFSRHLAQTQATMAAVAQSQLNYEARMLNHEEQLDEHNGRIARFERSYTAISDLLRQHDPQLVTLTKNANDTNQAVANLTGNVAELNGTVTRLVETVDRYIKARGTGSNGTA